MSKQKPEIVEFGAFIGRISELLKAHSGKDIADLYNREWAENGRLAKYVTDDTFIIGGADTVGEDQG